MKADRLRNRKLDKELQENIILYRVVCIEGINEELPLAHDYYRELWFDYKYNNDATFRNNFHNQLSIKNNPPCSINQ